MNNLQRTLFFFVLPALAALFSPLPLLVEPVMPISVFMILELILLVSLGFVLMRGKLTALTLSIFLQGLYVITGIMMFFPNAFTTEGQPDLPFIALTLLSISLAMYILLRLDKVDIRSRMA